MEPHVRNKLMAVFIVVIILLVFLSYSWDYDQCGDGVCLRMIIQKPRARLYFSGNRSGEEEYDVFNRVNQLKPPCHNFVHRHHKKQQLRSVDTMGTCIRLFSHRNCHGLSMAFYPKIGYPDRVPIYSTFRSIGQCLPNELRLSKSRLEWGSQGTRMVFTKLRGSSGIRFVPDMLHIGMPEPSTFRNVSETDRWPIRFYKLGHKGRVEFLAVYIYQEHVIRGVNRSRGMEFGLEHFADAKVEDVLGHFVGSKLGPQLHLPFHNSFPQKVQNRGLLSLWEQKIVDWHLKVPSANKTIEFVSLNMNVDYEYGWSTRPTGFVYEIQLPEELRSITYMTNQVY